MAQQQGILQPYRRPAPAEDMRELRGYLRALADLGRSHEDLLSIHNQELRRHDQRLDRHQREIQELRGLIEMNAAPNQAERNHAQGGAGARRAAPAENLPNAPGDRMTCGYCGKSLKISYISKHMRNFCPVRRQQQQ